VQKDGGLVVVYGHGEKLEPYDPQKVKEAKALDCAGGALAVKIAKQRDGVSIASERTPAIVTAFFDNGSWVHTTEGWRNLGKSEAQGKFSIVEARKSRKYTKALLTQCAAFSNPVGLVFEIVPQKDPFAAKPGDALPVKVLLDGKPVEGATITNGDAGHSDSKDLPKSDKDGKASVLIEKSGFQLIIASYKVPLKNDPDADALFLGATLTFGVP